MNEPYQQIDVERLAQLVQMGNKYFTHYEIIVSDKSGDLFYMNKLIPEHIHQIVFKNCRFLVKCNLSSSKSYTLIIEDCIFRKEVSMQNEMEALYIYNSEFEENFYFLTNVSGHTVIKNASFSKVFQYNPHVINSQDVRFIDCNFWGIGFFRRLIMNKNFIFNTCDLTNCSFLYSAFEDAIFANCTFDLNFKLSLDERILSNIGNITELLTDEQKKEFCKIDLKTIVSSYKEFEKNFDKARNYEEAGNFHKRAFELELKRKKGLSKIILWLYKKSSSYGEEYATSLKWMMTLLILFSFVYMFSGIVYTYSNESCVIYYCKPSNRYNIIQDIGIGFVYSFNSSIPIRKGFDFVESGSPLTSVLSIFQTLLQTILGTLFIISVRRKFRRK
jgi:hypothetical protein